MLASAWKRIDQRIRDHVTPTIFSTCTIHAPPNRPNLNHTQIIVTWFWPTFQRFHRTMIILFYSILSRRFRGWSHSTVCIECRKNILKGVTMRAVQWRVFLSKPHFSRPRFHVQHLFLYKYLDLIVLIYQFLANSNIYLNKKLGRKQFNFRLNIYDAYQRFKSTLPLKSSYMYM